MACVVLTTAPVSAEIVADFSADSSVGWYPFPVQFTNLSTYPADPNVEFFWDFGDGEFSTSKNPTHVYTTPGVFNVSLAIHAFDDIGEATKQQFITSLELVVDFSATPTAGVPPLGVSFTNNTTPEGWPYGYFWEFGDGLTSVETSPQHIYQEDGEYDVTLHVTPPLGLTRQLTKPGYIHVRTIPFLELAHDCQGPTFEFPTVEVQVVVNTESGLSCALDIDDFTITEDGVPQTIESIVCGSSGFSAADFVFVIDRSGTMADDIAAVRSEAFEFAADAIDAGVDARFGLITYVATEESDQELELPLTADVAEFEAALDGVVLTGAVEPALDSVIFALENMDFRSCARRVIVLITDETTEGDTHTMPEAIDAVNAAGATVVSISPDFNLQPREFSGPNDDIEELTRATAEDDDVRILAEETGGFWVDIVGADYSIILDEIVEFVASVWTVSYVSSNTAFDGTDRDVVLSMTDPIEGKDSESFTYTAPFADVFVRDNFRLLDADGDGRISEAEWDFGATFDGLDTNGDGFITLAEVLALTVGPVGVRTPIWVNFEYTGTESGHETTPFNTLDEAMAFVAAGGQVRVFSGTVVDTYTGAYAFQKPVQVISVDGPVTVGPAGTRPEASALQWGSFWEAFTR